MLKPSDSEEVLSTVEVALAIEPAPVAVADLPEQGFEGEHLRIVTNKLSEKAAQLAEVNQRLNALIDLNLKLSSEQDPEIMLERSCASARDIICAKYALLITPGDVTGKAASLFSSGMDAAAAARIPPGALDGLLRRLLAAQSSIRVRDVDTDRQYEVLLGGANLSALAI